MSLSKKQKDFLKTIENPKDKKYQKQQFKLQNKFDSSTLVFIGGVCSTKREEFERINGKGKTWMETTAKEVDEKFNKAVEKMYEEMRGSENSLTKESLRDITEPKAESLINKEAPKGKNILSEDLLFSENKKLDISIEVFIKDCEKWLLHDLDFGTCSEIKNRCVNFKQFELASKFRDKEIQILSKFDEEKLNSFLQQGFIDLNTIVQVKKLSKTDNQDIPKEFCVEITEENKEVLQKISCIPKLYRGFYLRSNSDGNYYEQVHTNLMRNPSDYEFYREVSTEEFLRYIGKEELIVKTHSTKTSETKPLDFDLPKKENPIQNIECLSINDIIDSGVLIRESPLCQNLRKYLVELVNKKTNPLNLK